MPRPKRLRRIGGVPDTTYFKPAGVRRRDLSTLVLGVDEYEAIKLADLQGLSQDEAASRMNISQPTFNRLIWAARKKIADAIVNGKAIRIEGGKTFMKDAPDTAA